MADQQESSPAPVDPWWYKYDKIKLLQLSQTPLSTNRPSLLSHEFNNEAGLWCPDLWLQSLWIKEGLESRGVMRRRQLDRLKAEHPCLDAAGKSDIILSPQRRSFGAGCRRANSPKDQQDMLAGGDNHWNRGDWRNDGGAKRSDKNYPYNWRDRNYDQKRDYGNGYNRHRNDSWREQSRRGGGDFQPSYRRDNRNNYHRRQEEMPEWMDEGPESMMDTIELHGFEDEKQQSNDQVQAEEQNKSGKSRRGNRQSRARNSTGSSRQNSRPSSRNMPAPSDTADGSKPTPAADQPTQMPSDLELAAMLGLPSNYTNATPDHLLFPIPNGPSAPSTSNEGSRFSKFFASKPSEADTNNNEAKKMAERASEGQPQLLRQLLGRGHTHTQDPGEPSIASLPAKAMSVEELERHMRGEAPIKDKPEQQPGALPQPPSVQMADEQHRLLMASLTKGQGRVGEATTSGDRRHMVQAQIAKGNPLQDPQQQAYLIDKCKQLQGDVLTQHNLTLQQQHDRRTPSPMNLAARAHHPQSLVNGPAPVSVAQMSQLLASMSTAGRLPVPSTQQLYPGMLANRAPMRGFPVCPLPADAAMRQHMLLLQLMQQQQQIQQQQRVSPALNEKRTDVPESNEPASHHPPVSAATQLNPAAAAFTPTAVLKQMASKGPTNEMPDAAKDPMQTGGRPIIKQTANAENERSVSPSTLLNQRISQEQIVRAQQQQMAAAAINLLAQQQRMPQPFVPPFPNQMMAMRAQHMAQLNVALNTCIARGDVNSAQVIRHRISQLQQVMTNSAIRAPNRGPSPPTTSSEAPQVECMRSAALDKLLASVAENAHVSTPKLPVQAISVEELEKNINSGN